MYFLHYCFDRISCSISLRNNNCNLKYRAESRLISITLETRRSSTIENKPRIILFEAKTRMHRDKFAWIAYFRRPVYPLLVWLGEKLVCECSCASNLHDTHRVLPRCFIHFIDRKGKFLPSVLASVETSEGTTCSDDGGNHPIYFFDLAIRLSRRHSFRANGDKNREIQKKIDKARLIKKPLSLCSHFEKGSVEYARNEFFHSIRVIKVVKSIRLRQETWRMSRLKLKFPFGPTWYSRSFFMNSLPLWDF